MSVFNPIRFVARVFLNSLDRMEYWLATKRTLHGVPVVIGLISSSYQEEDEALEKIDGALKLIAVYAPKNFGSLNKVVSSILVTSGVWAYGLYHPERKIIQLNGDYVTNPETTHQDVACTLIHEAQHGRLYRMGFGYEDAVRTRIERICMTAERNFARNLPDSEALVANLEERLELDWEPYLTDEEMWRSDKAAKMKVIRDFGMPDWIIRLLEWKLRRTEQRNFPRKLASHIDYT